MINRLPNSTLDVFQGLDRLFDQALRGIQVATNSLSPEIHDYQEDNRYILRIDLPGFRKSDVTLSVEKDELTIKANNDDLKRSYDRTFQLPEDVDQEAISAQLDLGILELSLPKKEEAAPKTRSIDVQ